MLAEAEARRPPHRLLVGPCSPWVHPGNTGARGAPRQHCSCGLEPAPSHTKMGTRCSPPRCCGSSAGPAGGHPQKQLRAQVRGGRQLLCLSPPLPHGPQGSKLSTERRRQRLEQQPCAVPPAQARTWTEHLQTLSGSPQLPERRVGRDVKAPFIL